MEQLCSQNKKNFVQFFTMKTEQKRNDKRHNRTYLLLFISLTFQKYPTRNAPATDLTGGRDAAKAITDFKKHVKNTQG